MNRIQEGLYPSVTSMLSNAARVFRETLTKKEWKLFSQLKSPARIQEYLDQLPYSSEDRYRCPLDVIRDHKAHCFDGAVFAAAALSFLGYPPMLVYMIAVRDDDHLVAPFRRKGFWGALGKSNYVGLRYREPIHRTIRELVVSYFESYFNVLGEKTLRKYTRPMKLSVYNNLEWMTQNEPLDLISDGLDDLQPIDVVNRSMIVNLATVDQRTYRSGLQGANRKGLYKVKG